MLRSLPIRFLATLGRRTITSDSNNYRHEAVIHGNLTENPSRKPFRCGQNLSDRFVRLEKSLRAKEVFSKKFEETGSSSMPSATAPLKLGTNVETFRGFELPEEPKAPGDSGECDCLSSSFSSGNWIILFSKIAACPVAPFASTTFTKNR